ncbi:MAG: hypothetical protein RMH81_06920 [Thermomicrobium sp.]|nr:hypothetical protein [Thermomicrobium sp.]
MRWIVGRALAYAILGAIVTTVTIGVPTAVVPNPLFGRQIPPDAIDYVLVGTTILLAAALAATYAWPTSCPLPERRLAAGTIVTYFAVGCPTCNKLVLLLLGSGGALQWFAPLQPLLGLLGVALLASSLVYRLRRLRPTGPTARRVPEATPS